MFVWCWKDNGVENDCFDVGYQIGDLFFSENNGRICGIYVIYMQVYLIFQETKQCNNVTCNFHNSM